MFTDILLVFFGYDIWFYISHILLHEYFYKIHAYHHTITNPVFLDAYVGHVIEGPFQGLGVFLPYLLIDFNVLAFLVAIALINVRGMMRHDSRCNWLIGNHHFLHHKYPWSNFGEYWIDRLCGTLNANEDEYEDGLFYI